ncbi:unnamed protein product, partial [Discosporangium mesarthrocarpum]
MKNGYYLIEFKPTLGWNFREHLRGYSHWAYGDLDVLFGDLSFGWLEPQELQSFDIITFSFGDQSRAYLRGQLTVHKNTPEINSIWRRCPHLSDYPTRIKDYVTSRTFTLQSAEGCYSKVLALDKNIRVKFAVKVFSDISYSKDVENLREVIIGADAVVKACPVTKGRQGEG